MKFTTIKTTSLLILFIAVTIMSCSSDDSPLSTPPQTTTPTSNYELPLTIGSNWIYDVSVDQATATEDQFTVNGEVTIDTYVYADFLATAGSTGTMTQLFDQNNFRTEDGVYYMKGAFNIPLSQIDATIADINIIIDDAKLFDSNTTSGTELTTLSDSQPISVAGYDFDVDYTFKTVQRETLASFTVGTETFDDVIKSDIIIRASASTNYEVIPGIFVPIELLAPQDVLVITNYYAANVGLIKSDNIFSYELGDISSLPITLPIDPTGSSTTIQEITSYTIID